MIRKAFLVCMILVLYTPLKAFRWIPYSQVSAFYGTDYRIGSFWQTIEIGVNFNTRPKHPLSYRSTTIQFSFDKNDRYLALGVEGRLWLKNTTIRRRFRRYLFPIVGIQLNNHWSDKHDNSISLTPRIGLMYRSHFMRKFAQFNIKCNYGFAMPFDVQDESNFERHGFQILVGTTIPINLGSTYRWLKKSDDKF